MAIEAVEATDSRKLDLANVLPELRECPGKALCEECFWWVDNGGQCSGCDDDYQQRCLKRVCEYNCYDCSGGGKATTPGCCGRTVVLWRSWRDRFKEILEYPVAEYTPAPLQLKCRLIPALYPDVRKFRIPEKFPQIDAWAVPLRRVAGRTGRFFSKDLKDYLGMPPDRKLILNTCAFDDYQEMLWEKGPEMKYREHGIDYWFPGHFSIYDDDSKLYQFISAKRQQIHAVWTESQFVWFRLGENIPVEFLNPVRNAPSVVISINWMKPKRNKAILFKELAIADKWFPPETAFFIVGSPRWLNLSDVRKCYEINTSWLVRALSGRDMAERRRLTRDELLVENLRGVIKNVH
jgi:hypothetical protein